MKKCPECDSEKIINNAFIREIGQGTGHDFVVHQKPEALFLKQSVSSDMRVEVCGDCGYIQMYAKLHRTLWDAYQTSISDVE